MVFFTEPEGYDKTILSDLQGGWSVLRSLVAENPSFDGWDKMLFHIDEAMSWETVRNLRTMIPMVTLIRNIAVQGKASKEIMDEIEDIKETLDEAIKTCKADQI